MIISEKCNYSERCLRDVYLNSKYIYLPNNKQNNIIFGGNPVEAKTPRLALLPRNLLSIEREVKGDLSLDGREKHNPRQSR